MGGWSDRRRGAPRLPMWDGGGYCRRWRWLTRYLYLSALLLSWASVVWLDRRLATGVTGRRLVRAILVTLPLFLCFDLVGASRGWFHSNPHLNSVIFPPGIPLEEPILLAFLTMISIALWRGAGRLFR